MSDWSSDVCSSDLAVRRVLAPRPDDADRRRDRAGRAGRGDRPRVEIPGRPRSLADPDDVAGGDRPVPGRRTGHDRPAASAARPGAGGRVSRRMRLSPTLSAYFGRQFTLWVLGTFAAIMAIVFLLDLIELMRRGSGKEGAYFAILIEMALLKLPSMGQQIMPFAVLFGSMLAFTRLTRTNELVVARAAGVSVWQFLMPAIAVALMLGALKVGVFNPVSSVMTAQIGRAHG